MNRPFWRLDGAEIALLLLGAGGGLLWTLVGLAAALAGWLPTAGSGSWNIAPPTFSLPGLLQIVLLLPIYLTFIVADGLHLRGDLLIPLATGIGMLIGAAGGAVLIARFR